MGRGCGWLVFHGDDIPSELADKAVDVTNLVEYDFIVLLPKRNHTAFLEARWKRAPLLLFIPLAIPRSSASSAFRR